jgi:glucokinase
VAVDIGGTSIKAIALDRSGRVHRRIDVATPLARAGVFDLLGGVIEELQGALAVNGSRLARLGVASPGLVDAGAGVVRFASNLDWRDLELGRRLVERFGVETAVENDARAGALAEHAWAGGAGTGTGPGGRGAGDLAFIPVGTGVSAAFYVGGDLARGASDAAGEFGHLRAVAGGEACTCGNRGCVEVYTSAANILARYRRAGGQLASTPEIVDVIDTDPLARRVWDEAVDALALGLAALVTLLDPSRIVIGGGLSLAGATLLEPLRRRFAQEISWRALPPIHASALGSHSTLVGAALLHRPATDGEAQSLARHLGAQLRDLERATPA